MRIISGSEPKATTYAIPGSPRDLVFQQHEIVHIPEVGNDYRREVTRIDFADGTTVFSFNPVDVQRKGFKLDVADIMKTRMEKGEFQKWVRSTKHNNDVPAEAVESQYEIISQQVHVIEWAWFEVTL